MEKLNKAWEIDGFELDANFLMDNQVHLLTKEGEELGISIKRMTNTRQLSRVLGQGKMMVDRAVKWRAWQTKRPGSVKKSYYVE